IGSSSEHIHAIYSDNIILTGIPINDLYISQGELEDGVLTLSSKSGYTLNISGFTYGTSGSSGRSGTAGTNGSSGTSGSSGSSGVDGTMGTSGVDGTSGSSGTSAT